MICTSKVSEKCIIEDPDIRLFSPTGICCECKREKTRRCRRANYLINRHLIVTGLPRGRKVGWRKSDQLPVSPL